MREIIGFNIINIGKKLKVNILNLSSWKMFFFCFIGVSLFRENKKVDIFALMIVIGIFIFRIIYRAFKFKSNYWIEVNGNSMSTQNDAIQRTYQFGDIVAIIINIMLISEKSEIGIKFLNSNWIVVFVYIAIFLVIATLSVRKNFIMSKVITLTLSTIQGFIALIGVLSIGTTMLTKIVNLELTNFSFIKEFKIMLILSSVLLENYAIYTIISIVITSILFYIYIVVTPIYQMSTLKKSFQILNIIMILGGIIIFFSARPISENIALNYNVIINEVASYKLPVEEFNLVNNYISNFNITNVKNIFYILALPYTFGIIISNFIIDYKVKKSELKQEEVLVEIQENPCKENKLEELKKQFYYNGGKNYQLNISLEYAMRKYEK